VLGRILPGAQHLQNIHPLAVHFPLALLPGAALFYLLAWLADRESLAWTALWLLVLGTASAAIAAATGLYANEGVMLDPTVREQLLNPHKASMLSTLGLSAVVTVWALARRPFPARGRSVFVLLLLVALVVMAHGADYGGRLVYDYNAGGNACGQPIGFTR
jgi:uncharacterized membrane protein